MQLMSAVYLEMTVLVISLFIPVWLVMYDFLLVRIITDMIDQCMNQYFSHDYRSIHQ